MKGISLTVLLAAMACSQSDFDAASMVLPDPESLPEQVEPPDLMQCWHGCERVEDAEQWTDWRRPEQQVLFAHYVYGVAPSERAPRVLSQEVLPWGDHEVVLVRGEVAELGFTLAVFRPVGGDAPVVLGLNKCGLHSLHEDPRLPLPTGWVEDGCPGGAGEDGRGGRSSYWDLDAVLDAGVAVATVHQSDFAADSPAATGGLRDVLTAEPRSEDAAWGVIASWSWSLSHMVDVLAEVDGVDAGDITVFGHSRRGKAALWATALDNDIAGVWAHQSGTGGQTLSRSFGGEPVAAMNTLFPHWFPPTFDAFGGRETFLPVDQHQLVALAAPRPVLLTDGADDTWADPPGAERSARLAAPAFTLLDADEPVWLVREGGHEVRSEDWRIWLESR